MNPEDIENDGWEPITDSPASTDEGWEPINENPAMSRMGSGFEDVYSGQQVPPENRRPMTGREYIPSPAFFGFGPAAGEIEERLQQDPEFLSAGPFSQAARRRDATTDANRELYRSRGVERDTGNGTQRVESYVEYIENENGNIVPNRRTYLVPEPLSAIDYGVDSVRSGVGRVIDGASSKLAQSIARTPEAIADFVGLGDPNTNAVDENIARRASANDAEEIMMEIGSMIVGGMAGARIVPLIASRYKLPLDRAKELYDTAVRRGQFFEERANQAQQSSPAIAAGLRRIGELGSRAARTPTSVTAQRIAGRQAEAGAIIGASLATPPEVEPFIGDEIYDAVEYLPFAPEDVRFLENVADNTAFSVGFATTLKVGGAIFGMVRGQFGGGIPNMTREQQGALGVGILGAMDPSIVNLETFNRAGGLNPEIGRRLAILGDTVLNNREFTTAFLGDNTVNVGDTLFAFRQGSRDYVQRVYADELRNMTPKDADAFINEKAGIMSEKLLMLKRGMANAGAATIDSRLASNIEQIITRFADRQATATDANRAFADAGAQEADRLNRATDNLNIAERDLQISEDALRTQQQATAPTVIANQQYGDNVLSARENALRSIREVVDNQYPDWAKSYEAYNKAFENLPDGTPIDAPMLEGVMRGLDVNLYKPAGVRDAFVDELERIIPDPNASSADILANLQAENIDLKQLYTRWIPELERVITRVRNAGTASTRPLEDIKRRIYTMAEQSGSDEWRKATDMYKEHVAAYRRIPAIAAYEDLASQIRPIKFDDQGNPLNAIDFDTITGKPIARGQENAREYFMNQLLSSVYDPTGGKIQPFVAIIARQGPQAEESLRNFIFAEATMAMRPMLSNAGNVTSDGLASAIEPYMTALSYVSGGEQYKQLFQTAFRQLRDAERGVFDSREAVAFAQRTFKEVNEQIGVSELGKFMRRQPGQSSGAAPLAPNDVYNSALKPLFNSSDVNSRLQSLVSEINTAYQQNPAMRDTLMNGLRSQYIRYMQSKVFGTSSDGLSKTNPETSARNFINGIKTIVEDPNEQYLTAFRTLFANEPNVANSFEAFLREVNTIAGGRNTRVGNAGVNSITPDALQLQDTVNRLITITLGVLNPTATTTRALSRGVITRNQAEAEKGIQQLFQIAMDDPRNFAEIMRVAAEDRNGTYTGRMVREAIANINYEVGRGASKYLDSENEIDRATSDDPSIILEPGFVDEPSPLDEQTQALFSDVEQFDGFSRPTAEELQQIIETETLFPEGR